MKTVFRALLAGPALVLVAVSGCASVAADTPATTATSAVAAAPAAGCSVDPAPSPPHLPPPGYTMMGRHAV
jgi:hypothetical protein